MKKGILCGTLLGIMLMASGVSMADSYSVEIKCGTGGEKDPTLCPTAIIFDDGDLQDITTPWIYNDSDPYVQNQFYVVNQTFTMNTGTTHKVSIKAPIFAPDGSGAVKTFICSGQVSSGLMYVLFDYNDGDCRAGDPNQ